MDAVFLAIAAAALAQGSAGGECEAVPGLDQILERPELEYLVLGELHGTMEMPAVFGDAVCQAADVRRVSVALEFPEIDQPLFDAYLQSGGREEALAALVAGPLWQMDMRDGRTSVAMVALLEELEDMYAAGRITGITVMQPAHNDGSGGLAGYEAAMAELVKTAAQDDALVMVLVGNAHARRTEVPWPPQYIGMAGHLPQDTTVTLDMLANGGESWNCTGQPVTCGSSSSPAPPEPFAYGVDLADDESEGPYSGMLFLGTEMTASPPYE